MTNILRDALMEMCERRQGQLTADEILHVFELVAHSTELFSVYGWGYRKCVGLRNSPQFTQIDENVITHFVVWTYCRDVVEKVFRNHVQIRGTPWGRAFTNGFAAFLVRYVNPELPQDLFGAYKQLVMHHAGSLTPVTILNADSVLETFSKSVSLMRARFRDDPSAVARMEEMVNESLARELGLDGPAGERLDRTGASSFVTGLAAPSKINPFRIRVDDRIDASRSDRRDRTAI